MEVFKEILFHSFKHSIQLLPLLLVVYFLLELIEYKGTQKLEKSKLLKGKWSPVLGSLVGSVPQCGFSVISTDLFASKKISVATLVAVYVATSDEAIPLMIANIKSIPTLLILISVKIVFAIALGYFIGFLHKLVFKNPYEKIIENEKKRQKELKQTELHEEDEDNHTEEHHDEQLEESHDDHDHMHLSAGCCNHSMEDNKYDWKHPLLHSLKIFAFIFIINFIFEGVLTLVGEAKLMAFLDANSSLQPLLALIIGLIPNCASSVVLTEMYLSGLISFGSITAGLSVNAGLGFVVLFKQNKNLKENLFILSLMLIFSLAFGYLLHFLI